MTVVSGRRLLGTVWLGGPADTTVRLVNKRTARLGGPTQLAALRWLLLVAGVPSDLRSLLDRARRRQRPDIVQLVEQAAAKQQQQQQDGQGDAKATKHRTRCVAQAVGRGCVSPGLAAPCWVLRWYRHVGPMSCNFHSAATLFPVARSIAVCVPTSFASFLPLPTVQQGVGCHVGGVGPARRALRRHAAGAGRSAVLLGARLRLTAQHNLTVCVTVANAEGMSGPVLSAKGAD